MSIRRLVADYVEIQEDNLWFVYTYINMVEIRTYIQISLRINLNYHIAGKLGEFGESSMIFQTKTIQISTYNYNLLAESIHLPNFFCQMLEMSKFAKLYPCPTFPLYGMRKNVYVTSFTRHLGKINHVCVLIYSRNTNMKFSLLHNFPVPA